MVFAEISPENVLNAIALLDDPREGPKLLNELHFGPSRHYRLLYQGKFYDSKPVVGIAHGLSTAGEYLSGRDFTGGYSGAVRVLRQLGFYVDEGWLHGISRLRVDKTHGRPAPYQHMVLLWAIARARRRPTDQPRIVPFNEVRAELAELLAPFALADTRPDPVDPWLALTRSSSLGVDLWDGEMPPAGTPLNDSSVLSFNLAGGLSLQFDQYVRGREGDQFVEAAVDFVPHLIGDQPAYPEAVGNLGLTDPVSEVAGPGESPEVADAKAVLEELSNPRRRYPRGLTPAQNRAIEMRAVDVVRKHFERELGFATEDVGATHSYDVRASKDGEVIKVEVKGTTSDGSGIVLTRNEVNLHRVEHPNNALAVVRHIALDHGADEPVATGGDLVLLMPWKIDESALSAIAYDYSTGL
jgi:Domain of unknown function (DUF3883)